MKKKRLLLVLLSMYLPLMLIAQSASLSTETAKDLRRIAAGASVDFLLYQYTKEKPNYKEIDYVTIFKSYMDTVSIKDPLLNSNKANIEKVYSQVIKSYYGQEFSDTRLLNKDCSVAVLNYMPNSKCLIFKNLIYTSVYNTINVDTGERAKRITQSVVLPFLGSISEYFSDNQNIGVVIAYGAKDFSEKYTNASADCLIAIVDAKSAKDFYNLRITEQDFLSKCNFYILDGQSRNSNLKKVIVL